MGSDAGARFQQLRGNPNFFVDGRPGTDTFVGNQREFKKGNITQTLGGVPKAFGDKNLFKQVHPNPLKILLGAATQAGNISPMGLVRNIEKIRTGQPLMDLSFMDRNMSESPSRMKDFYSAYMEGMNKKIADAKSSKNADQFDAVPLDPQFRDLEGSTKTDFSNLSEEEYNELWNKAQTLDQITGESSTGDPTRIADDKDLQEDMERSLLNQYSLLEDPSLADTLLDDTEETDLEEAINPVVEDREKINIDESLPLGNITASNIFDPLVEAEKDEYLDTYGAGSVPYNKAKQMEKEKYEEKAKEDDRYKEGGRFDFDKETPGAQSMFDYHEKKGLSPNRQREYIMESIDPNFTYFPGIMPYEYRDRFGALGDESDFSGFQDVPYNTGNIPAEQFKDVLVPGDPRLPIPPFSFPGLEPKPFKDGGSVNTYDVLKLINDTMNDG